MRENAFYKYLLIAFYNVLFLGEKNEKVNHSIFHYSDAVSIAVGDFRLVTLILFADRRLWRSCLWTHC